jgi:hypothetical protein
MAAGKGLGGKLAEIGKGLVSKDPSTRRMSLFFFISLAVTATVGIATVKHFAGSAASVGQAEHAGGESATIDTHGGSEHASAPPASVHSTNEHGVVAGHGDAHGGGHGHAKNDKPLTLLDLGRFSIQLKGEPNAQALRANGSKAGLADVSLVLECDSPETYEYLEQRSAQVRNEITGALDAVDREELLSRLGKNRLKSRVKDQVNGWLPKGKVLNVYISGLMAG